MQERYFSKWSWLRHKEPAIDCEQTCELGTRRVLLSAIDVIYRAANRHISRTHPEWARWG